MIVGEECPVGLRASPAMAVATSVFANRLGRTVLAPGEDR
jgi:hypothetical protein